MKKFMLIATNTEPNFDIPIKMQNTTASEPKIKVNSTRWSNIGAESSTPSQTL